MTRKPKKVTITVRGKRINVDPDPVEVSKSRHGCICWECADANVVVLLRRGSPFLRNRRKFVVRKGKSCVSPSVRASVKVGSHYSYTVRSQRGSHDPEIIIKT